MKRIITSIFAVMLALAMVLSLAACGGNGENKKDMADKTSNAEVSKFSAENAISATPKHIYEDCEANLAKAKQNTYLMKCVVKEISDTDFGCGWSIRVCLPTDELVKLNKDDKIVVIGKVTEKRDDDYIIGEAEIYDGEVPEPEVRESDIIEGKLEKFNGEWKVGIYEAVYGGEVLYDIILADPNDESKLRENATIRFTGDKSEGYDIYTNVKIISVE